MTNTIDLDRPYLGWLNHYEQGWQAALVRMKNGERTALRLGDPVGFDHATLVCRVLSETTGLPVAGERSKKGFLPVSEQGGEGSCPTS
jgi:hypothetical protein